MKQEEPVTVGAVGSHPHLEGIDDIWEGLRTKPFIEAKASDDPTKKDSAQKAF